MANEVTYEREESIALIAINRPEVKNSLNLAVFRELDRALDAISSDEDVRVIIITGAGDSFVAGADIKELLTFDSITGWAASRFEQSVYTKLEKIGKPSIAAINGFALGGGLELALSCTFRVASVTAKLGLPELGLGIIPAFGGTERLVRTVGYAKASELILLRTLVDGQEAQRIGLVNYVVDQDQVLTRAREIAAPLCSLSPVAARFELELLLQCGNAGFDQALALESCFGALSVSSKEAKELLAKFVSGRKESK